MGSLVLRRHASKFLPILLAAIAGPVALKATTLAATPATLNFTCNTATGPGVPQTINLKSALAIGVNVYAVTFGVPGNGITVTAPLSGTTLNTATNGAGLTYTVSLANGCNGVTAGATQFFFKVGGVNDVQITVNVTLVTTTSGLSAPSNVTVTCVRTSVPAWTPGSAVTVSIGSTATGGTPFTVDTVTNPYNASDITLSSTSGGTPTPSSSVTFTIVAPSGCNARGYGTYNTSVHLLSTGTTAPDKVIVVSLQIVPPTTLTSSPVAPSLTYVKGSGTAGYVDVNVTSSSSTPPFMSIDTSSLPSWLTVDSTTGLLPKSFRFSSTTLCDTFAPGVYSAGVHLKVSGYGDQVVTVTLLITNKAPKLGVVEGTTRNISWTIGNAVPTAVVTAQSTDTPIAYTVTTGGTLAPTVGAGQQNGLAYSFGTPINISFNPLVFAAAQPNNVLTGTVTLTWGSPASTIVVTFNVTVQSPGATVSGLSPATLPTAAPGGAPFQLSLTGTGFVPSTDLTQRTRVGIVVGGQIVTDPNISANIVNPSNMTLTITVNASDNTNLPFSPSGPGTGSTPVVIGVCNPGGTTCSVPTGTASLAIGINPIIQAVTSSATFIQVNPPSLPTVAPYDMISIFGANFCTSSGTGCSSNTILYGTVDTTSTASYPIQLTPDSGGSPRQLSVQFLTHGTSTVLGTAPLLFATNGQINALVPAGVCPGAPPVCPATADIVVNFGTLHSTAYQVNIAATDPGIFTIGASGQGPGAILDTNWNLVSANNIAGMRNAASGSADSDQIQLYMTGLGIPDSTASGAGWSAHCLTPANYLTAFNSAQGTSLTGLDGTLILQSPLSGSQVVPCIKVGGSDAPTVTVGGVAATVLYAGWAPNEVAGLYQVNVQLPASTAGPFSTISGGTTASTIAAPAQLPIVVTSNSIPSQAAVSVWVGPKLYVAGPDNVSGMTGTVGASWPVTHNVVTANDGTAPYTFAVTTGLLPSGITLNASTGVLAGIPAAGTAGTYQVTVTATDSVALTGSVTFTLTVNGGLFLTSSGSAPYSATHGVANNNLTTVTAASGVAPYTYSLTSPPAGFSIVPASGLVKTTAPTLAGSYHITAHAVDTTSGTPLVGDGHFDVVVAGTVPTPSLSAVTSGTAKATVATVVANSTGGFSGTPTYTMSTAACLSIDHTSGVISADTTCVSGANPSVTVTATDSTNASGAYAAGIGTVTFTVTIN